MLVSSIFYVPHHLTNKTIIIIIIIIIKQIFVQKILFKIEKWILNFLEILCIFVKYKGFQQILEHHFLF